MHTFIHANIHTYTDVHAGEHALIEPLQNHGSTKMCGSNSARLDAFPEPGPQPAKGIYQYPLNFQKFPNVDEHHKAPTTHIFMRLIYLQHPSTQSIYQNNVLVCLLNF